MDSINIGGRRVGVGEPVFIVGEAGSNHDRKLTQARKLIEVAAQAECDAVKFQTFKADRIVAKVTDRPKYLEGLLAPGQTLHETFRGLQLPDEWHAELRDHAKAHGILFFSTPFDEESADLLESIGVPCYKIASFELNHLPLIEHVAQKKKPMIVSTGMADLSDIEEALAVIYRHQREVILLHCASVYPAAAKDANLRAMATMRSAFSIPIGFSDHTLGWAVSIAAVSLGACVLEKHFTIDKTLPGPDHPFALDAHELEAMVKAVREVEASFGTGRKQLVPAEEELSRLARRRIFAIVDIPKGASISRDKVAILRGTEGLEPRELDRVVGRTARRPIKAHTAISWNDV